MNKYKKIDASLNTLISGMNLFRLTMVVIIIILNGVFGIIYGPFSSLLFYVWGCAYFLVIGFFAVYIKLNLEEKFSLFYLNVIDIIMMSIFMYLTGNIAGFGILIVPFVATSSILGVGRYNLFYGAVASLAIMLCSVLQMLFHNVNYNEVLYLFSQAGVLSAVCLVVSYVTSILAKNLSRIKEVSLTKEEEIAHLNRLNELVLQRLNDIVVVLDKNGDVRHYNLQAKNYFPFLARGKYFHVFQPIITEWKDTDKKLFLVDCKISNVQTSGRAISIDEFGDKILLLLLRSAEDLANESQKIKLESLGRLTANIAHEIRNPLSAIRQSNELLSENNDDDLSKKFTGIIGKNVERIDNLVEEVLMLNKRDRINQVEIYLEQFMKDFLTEFELATPEARGRVKIKFSLQKKSVFFDFGHLQQILWNLINNAWRHADKRNPVVVVYINQERDFINISISDSGDGVPKSIAEHIFEPFFTTEKQGTGLGLYIARELALANGAYLDYLPQTKRFEMKCKVKENEH